MVGENAGPHALLVDSAGGDAVRGDGASAAFCGESACAACAVCGARRGGGDARAAVPGQHRAGVRLGYVHGGAAGVHAGEPRELRRAGRGVAPGGDEDGGEIGDDAAGGAAVVLRGDAGEGGNGPGGE